MTDNHDIFRFKNGLKGISVFFFSISSVSFVNTIHYHSLIIVLFHLFHVLKIKLKIFTRSLMLQCNFFPVWKIV